MPPRFSRTRTLCSYLVITKEEEEEDAIETVCFFLDDNNNNMNEKPLLVLDLNKVLIEASRQRKPLGEPNFLCRVKHKWIYTRPGLQEFIDWASDRFDLGIWTSSMQRNAEPVIDAVFGPQNKSRFSFILYGEDCVEARHPPWKNLKPMGRIPGLAERQGPVIMVDDDKEKIIRSRQKQIQHIIPVPFDASREFDASGLQKLRHQINSFLLPGNLLQ